MNKVDNNSNSSNSADAYNFSNPEVVVKKYSELLTDQEIDSLSKEELKERLKNSQISVLNKENQIRLDHDKFALITSQYQDAIAQASTKQSVNNLAANRQNHAQYTAMGTETKLCTAGRIAALVMTVVSLIITVICLIV